MATILELRLADIARLKELSATDPTLSEAEEPAQFTRPFLEKIGIFYQPQLLGEGYIKHSYRDFIVEEITENGQVISIAPGPLTDHQLDSPPPADRTKKLRLEVDMVKQGFSTFEAIEQLATELGLDLNQISYAGLKDGKAITAQRVSINQVTVDRLSTLNLPNIFLKNGHYRVGMGNIGELIGNRFTILVRTKSINQEQISTRLKGIGEQGFLNFFSLQRFGGRLLSHKIGKQVMLGRHDDAIRLLLAGVSPHETRALQDLRQQAISIWRDWEKIGQLFGQYPYFFQHELKAIESLKIYPDDMAAALRATPDQTKMAYSAYGSYCFNQVLSQQATTGQIDPSIALLGPESVAWYDRLLPEEGLKQLRWHQPTLNFLGRPRSRSIPARVGVDIHSVTPTEVGLIFHFDLTKGAYATTFLAELFGLYQGRPIPSWVHEESVDIRAAIGYPSIETTEQAFPSLPANLEEDIADD